MSMDEVIKIIEVKRMDLEECEHELNNRYYPTIVRIAMMNYISLLRQQLEWYSGNVESLEWDGSSGLN